MCFSLAWIAQLLIWCVVILAVFAVIKIIVPWALSKFGADASILVQVLQIIMWAVIVIAIIIIVLDLLSCLLGMGGGLHLPRPR